MKEIHLSGGLVAVIDEADFDLVAKHKWCAHHIDGNVYAATNVVADGKNKTVHMHRLISEPGNDLHVDHEDGNGLNNTRANLRACTNAQNRLNAGRYKNNTSGCKGVSWCKKTEKWYARIAIGGKRKFLGFFDTLLDAAASYKQANAELHGEFGRAE